jgi:hypothetical protein
MTTIRALIESLRELAELSTDPVNRAVERINMLLDRGADPIRGTLQRLKATSDRDKIKGIETAAGIMAKNAETPQAKKQWDWVASEAKKKYKAATN